MVALLCFCPCSRLSIPSKGYLPRLGDFERSRVGGKTPWNPISLRCDNANVDVENILSCNSQEAFEELQAKSPGVERRHVALGLFVSALSLPPLANAVTSERSDLQNPATVSTAVQVDDINAYVYSYPVALDRPPSTIKWVESRKPERYSSAAPLSPDARQRIVSERLSFPNNIVVSVSVGPPNSTFLKDNVIKSWGAEDVARSVLADKSTARMTTGQRVAEVSILDTKTDEKDGVIRYWYYEYVVQKSPTVSERGLDVFRHSVAVTAEREGYLYTLNTSTSSKNWNRFSPMLKESISSFRLLPPTAEYVPPYKDPWRFW